MELFSFEESAQWDELIADLPGAHALQTQEWGEVKRQTGWQPHPLVWRDQNGSVQAAALVLQRWVLRGGFVLQLSVMYCPRGPLLDWSNANLAKRVLDDLQVFARKNNAIFIKIDPDLPLGFGIPGEANAKEDPTGIAVQQDLKIRRWIFSDEQIQFKNTVLVDLTADEDEILARMKSKTRYNIRLAERRGVLHSPRWG